MELTESEERTEHLNNAKDLYFKKIQPFYDNIKSYTINPQIIGKLLNYMYYPIGTRGISVPIIKGSITILGVEINEASKYELNSFVELERFLILNFNFQTPVIDHIEKGQYVYDDIKTKAVKGNIDLLRISFDILNWTVDEILLISEFTDIYLDAFCDNDNLNDETKVWLKLQ